MWGKVLCVLGGVVVGYMARDEIGSVTEEICHTWHENFGHSAGGDDGDETAIRCEDEGATGAISVGDTA